MSFQVIKSESHVEGETESSETLSSKEKKQKRAIKAMFKSRQFSKTHWHNAHEERGRLKNKKETTLR
jgi:hypothetical protein